MATLTTTVKESVTINGKVFGREVENTVASVTDVRQVVIPVATTPVDLLNFSASTESLGTLVDGDLKYFRVTNLDSTNFVSLIVYDGTNYVSAKLTPGASLILNEDSVGNSPTINNPTLGQLDSITAASDTAVCKVEVFIAK